MRQDVLLRAGVLPSLCQTGGHHPPGGSAVLRGLIPLPALPAHNPYTLALLRSWTPGETATRLVGMTVHEFIQRQADHGIVLAAIDPADELLADTGPRRAHRRRFLGELSEALAGNSRLHLLVVGREEAIGVMAGALGGGAQDIRRGADLAGCQRSRDQARSGQGRPFADGAAEKLVTELQTSHIRRQ